MSTIPEIEAAIKRLPDSELNELAAWFESYRGSRTAGESAEAWLGHAIGAARPEITTASVMAMTRGEE